MNQGSEDTRRENWYRNRLIRAYQEAAASEDCGLEINPSTRELECFLLELQELIGKSAAGHRDEFRLVS